MLQDGQYNYRALMGTILPLHRIQELNQQGVCGPQSMLVQRYMLVVQEWLQNGLSVILMYWFLKMLLTLSVALINLGIVYSFFHLVKRIRRTHYCLLKPCYRVSDRFNTNTNTHTYTWLVFCIYSLKSRDNPLDVLCF